MADPQLKLYGFPISNYYNKVKLALLEKEIPHEDVRIAPSQEEDFLRMSPLGKIPFIESEGRFIFESSVIFEFLESMYPERPLLPADPYAAALVREIIAVVDLHLDGPARSLFGASFRGGEAPPEMREKLQKKWKLGLAALRSLARFDPFIAGSEYTYADAAAYATVSLLDSFSRKLYPGQPTLTESIPEYGDYAAMIAERPATKKVDRARKAAERARAMAAKKK
ncbi:MAG: glutathione S-transferase family protein [bacterium]|nr:glutathione S-transferase family protein [bacterium]